ncbi:MAG: tRNA (adenosine(37)-N6)-dimethylallyltransferase MiaA [Bacteroidales bacterium]|nr:tRNA (adenosine(37)-N6)-dimethylallyltransferase MiaA [Bacteroidales bacterium]
MKTLYVIAGPTASGKTSFAVCLAQKLKTEILSADSRQIFKEMNIGVARPTQQELDCVPHHFIAEWNVGQTSNAARYEKEALCRIDTLFQKHESLVLCGGSGLYIDALLKGIDFMPDISLEVRNEVQRLYKERGLAFMQNVLKEKDREYFALVDIQNPRRVLRALEVCFESGKPFSSFRKQANAERSFETKVFGLKRARAELVERIDKRVGQMLEEGLLAEAESLIPLKHLQALNTVGYKELFDYFDKKTSLNDAVELIKIHTRQYAKRQMTWFNKTENLIWLDLSKEQSMDYWIERILSVD